MKQKREGVFHFTELLNPKRVDPDKLVRGTVTKVEHRVLLWTLEAATALRALTAIIPAGKGEYTTKKFRPVFLELGTHRAMTSRAMVQALNALGVESTFVTVDIDYLNTSPRGPTKKDPGFYPRDEWSKILAELPRDGACKAQFIEGCSYRVADRVPGPLVWVFVDACHCQECVEREIKAYAPRVAPGGFLIFHDCGEEYRGYPPDQAYHGGPARPFGVVEVVTRSKVLEEEGFELFTITPPMPKSSKYFGGAYIYRRREERDEE